MAEKEEKETVSSKMNAFLEKNRKLIIGLFIAILAAVLIFIAVEIIVAQSTTKNLATVDALTFELTDGSNKLEDAELESRRNDVLVKVEPLTKKGGVAGVRANMLAAELAYQKKDYEAAINYWNGAIAKGKKSYTAPLAYYNKAVCYEQLNKLDDAAETYKVAADNEDFILRTHAKFSYGRVLETQGKYKEAVEVYQALNDSNPDDSWAKLAKTRIISLKVEGKAE